MRVGSAASGSSLKLCSRLLQLSSHVQIMFCSLRSAVIHSKSLSHTQLLANPTKTADHGPLQKGPLVYMLPRGVHGKEQPVLRIAADFCKCDDNKSIGQKM